MPEGDAEFEDEALPDEIKQAEWSDLDYSNSDYECDD